MVLQVDEKLRTRVTNDRNKRACDGERVKERCDQRDGSSQLGG